jgi:hypothetical protein
VAFVLLAAQVAEVRTTAAVYANLQGNSVYWVDVLWQALLCQQHNTVGWLNIVEARVNPQPSIRQDTPTWLKCTT